MRRHIDRHLTTLKEKPDHVRERIALGTAGALTALVAVVWVTSLVTSGSLALRAPSELAETDPGSAFNDTRSNFSELMGAVGAVGSSSDPELTIVDGETSSTITAPPPQPPSDATVIPF